MFRSFSDKKSPRKSFRLKPPFTRHAISILICAACMLCATLASFLYQHIVPDNHANVALFYILALVIIARWTVGYGYGIACTLFSVIAINYLFTYPYYKLNFTLTGYPITFLLMSGITLILCTMTSHMTIQSEMIAEREKRLAEAEMEKMRANLLRAISHDLRTPLTMVKAYAEMVRDISWRDEKKRNEHCNVIIDEADRLTMLVNDILDLTKPQAGTREPDLKRLNLSKLVSNVLERFAILSEQSGYGFSLSTDEDCFVLADERMVEQIVYNLVGNAGSYTGDDKKVSVAVRRLAETVRVEISDTGKGIAPSERDKVWDR